MSCFLYFCTVSHKGRRRFNVLSSYTFVFNQIDKVIIGLQYDAVSEYQLKLSQVRLNAED